MNEKKSPKILFVAPRGAQFCLNDYNIISERFIVKKIDYSWSNLKSVATLPLKIIKGAIWADISVCWFGSFHSLLTIIIFKMLNKKNIVIAGGYDAVRMPEFNYGLMRNRLSSIIPTLSFTYADSLLAVSQNTINDINKNTNIKNNKIILLYNGIDTNKYYSTGEKDNIVLTVAFVTRTSYKRKGIDYFIKTARQFPQYKFILAGKIEEGFLEMIKNNAPSNLIITGYLPEDQLLLLYQRAKIYFQHSFHEAFGCSVVEAMLCECIPVVSNGGALPEVVGDTGFIISYGDESDLFEKMKIALNDDGKGILARQRALRYFDLSTRKDKLISIIERLT